MATTRPTVEQVLSWAGQGDLESLSTKVPLELLSKADATGMRAMHMAASRGQTKVVEWLVEDERRDTGVNKPDEDARGPLHWAAWHGQAETVKSLLEMGAIRDRPTRTGFTPLHYACFSGSLATVKVLVEYGVKIDSKDESQQTPRDIALRFERHDIVKYLDEDAPEISAEALKKYDYLPTATNMMNEASSSLNDPIIEAIQYNEEHNLERILTTASKMAAKDPVPSSQSVSLAKKKRPIAPSILSEDADVRFLQKQVLFGVVVFLATFGLGLVMGKYSAGTDRRRSDL